MIEPKTLCVRGRWGKCNEDSHRGVRTFGSARGRRADAAIRAMVAERRMGTADQAGASNRITPDKIMQALSVVRTGQVYEVGRVYEAGMPLGATRSFALTLLATAQPQGANRVVYNDEFLAAKSAKSERSSTASATSAAR